MPPITSNSLDLDQSVESAAALEMYDSVASISVSGAEEDDVDSDFVQSVEHVDVDRSFNFDAADADPSVDGSQALDAYDFVQPIQPIGDR